jgi:hypothetical protein
MVVEDKVMRGHTQCQSERGGLLLSQATSGGNRSLAAVGLASQICSSSTIVLLAPIVERSRVESDVALLKPNSSPTAN